MKTKKYLTLIAVVMLLLLSTPKPAAAQCAMCKKIVETNMDSKSNKVGRGLNKGILYMLCFPYLLGATAGVIWYRNRKKKPEDTV